MGLASSRYAGTIGAKNNDVKFFFNFFFRRLCGCLGVEVLGCGAHSPQDDRNASRRSYEPLGRVFSKK